MLVVVVSGLFALVFARTLAAYLRTRDPLHGSVALVFTAVAGLFAIQLTRYLFGDIPEFLRLASVILLLGQPYFTLRMVARLRPMPRYAVWATGVGWIATSLLITLTPPPLPGPVLIVILGYFVVPQFAAAIQLTREARRRTGAPRVRLAAAAVGTGLFAVALLTAGAGQSTVASTISRVMALASAIGYTVAFLPPGWLRRWWSARAAYTLMGRMLAAPGSGTPELTWQHYADTVVEAVDADAAVVAALGADGKPRRIAVAGRPGAEPAQPADDELDRLMYAAVLRLAATSRTKAGRDRAGRDKRPHHNGHSVTVDRDGGVATALPLTLHAGGTGLLIVLGRHRSLFTEDDVALLTDLGRQATVLAERDVLTATLSAMVGALRAANHAKSDFLAAMSHELRTPLNAIIGFSELMGEEELAEGRRVVPDEWITNVHSSGRHLLGLINDVLDLAKVEAGRVELRCEPLDVGAVVAEAVAPLRPLLDRKRLRLTVAVPPVAVSADRLRVRQMLNNLLSNAIKFTPDGGSLFISAHRAGAYTHLSVADTGPGIEPADQQRVFEEFHQSGDAESRAAGTGLGLTLTRRLAEAHGGRIELRSQPGHGSRFTLVLPAAEPSVSTTQPSPTLPQGCGGILIVEDDPSAASLLHTYLTNAGYTVSCAASGEEGLAAAAQCAPDVILLDVLLPGMDGWEVLQRLKNDDRLRHIPVAMVTVVDEREVGLALGAVDYFVKPVERGMLLAWLARHGLVPPLSARQPDVLAVDADPQTLQEVDRCLRAEGLNVVTATTGSEALRLAGDRPFDLVICDLLLPDVDGYTLITALQDNPLTRNVPVVALTNGDLTERQKASLHGRILGVVSKTDLDAAELCMWLSRATNPLIPAPVGAEPVAQPGDGAVAAEQAAAAELAVRAAAAELAVRAAAAELAGRAAAAELAGRAAAAEAVGPAAGAAGPLAGTAATAPDVASDARKVTA